MTTHESNCLASAVSFTAVRGRGASRTRKDATTLDDAKAFGNGDGRTMIYAVTESGNSAHIINC